MPAAQTAVDCLMLWKLTRVGEVGMDMARATRARMECLSCHRCHLFRMAERTCGNRAEHDVVLTGGSGPLTHAQVETVTLLTLSLAYLLGHFSPS